MESNKDNSAGKESSTDAAIERGKEAVKADEKINNKTEGNPKRKDEEKKDAERWRNEG